MENSDDELEFRKIIYEKFANNKRHIDTKRCLQRNMKFFSVVDVEKFSKKRSSSDDPILCY